MAYKILTSQCSVCGSCEFECPNAAIRMKGETYVVDPNRCSECDGDGPKCVDICPVPGTCVPA